MSVANGWCRLLLWPAAIAKRNLRSLLLASQLCPRTVCRQKIPWSRGKLKGDIRFRIQSAETKEIDFSCLLIESTPIESQSFTSLVGAPRAFAMWIRFPWIIIWGFLSRGWIGLGDILLQSLWFRENSLFSGIPATKCRRIEYLGYHSKEENEIL